MRNTFKQTIKQYYFKQMTTLRQLETPEHAFIMFISGLSDGTKLFSPKIFRGFFLWLVRRTTIVKRIHKQCLLVERAHYFNKL